MQFQGRLDLRRLPQSARSPIAVHKFAMDRAGWRAGQSTPGAHRAGR